MPDSKQLPYLLQLLEDESPFVQKAVIQELSLFGPHLREELVKFPHALNAHQRKTLLNILSVHNRRWLQEQWPGWSSIKGEKVRLQAAFSLLSEFLSGFPLKLSLETRLDMLAAEFLQARIKKDAYGLAYFLFEVKGLSGAKTDYYNPQNSNLFYILEEKRGIPISLTSLYMLIAARLGFAVEGCSFPGYFLARIEFNGREVLVDCFNGGRILSDKDIAKLKQEISPAVQEVLTENASTAIIMSRVLENLIRAFEKNEDIENSQLMFELLSTLEFSNLPIKVL